MRNEVKYRFYVGMMGILLLLVVMIAVDVARAQSTVPIENRLTICDGRTVTPFPKPTWTPDPITAVIDKPLATCYIGVTGNPWACIENTSIWECAQFGLVNGDGSIAGSGGYPICLPNCHACKGISYLPLIMK